MIILLAIAAAVIGVLFWADRRFPRTRHYHAGPVIISDWARAAPDNDFGDVHLSARTLEQLDGDLLVNLVVLRQQDPGASDPSAVLIGLRGCQSLLGAGQRK